MFMNFRESADEDTKMMYKREMCVSERMSALYMTKKHADVEFIVGSEAQQSFKAHKLILAIGSPVFDAMFFGQMQESQESQLSIFVPDATPETFETMLSFLYTDKVELKSVHQTSCILYIARKYLIPPLEKECVSYFQRELCPQNICQIYACATLMDLNDLLDVCPIILKCNISDILKSEGFLNAEQSTVKTIIKQPELDILEGEIFTAVYKWATAECLRKSEVPLKENLRSAILPLLSDIRFLRMSPLEFVQNVVEHNVLNLDESSYILVQLINPGSTTVLRWPKHFELSTQS